MSTRGRSAADYAAEQGTGYQQGTAYQEGVPQMAEPARGGGGAVAGAVLAGVLMMLSGLYGVSPDWPWF